MKTVAVAVAALALQVVAHESLDKADYFPKCSLDCLTEAIEKGVDCKETDSICLCDHENYVAIYEYSVDCIIDACGEDVAVDEVLPAAEPYCSDAASLYSATATSPLPSHTHSHDEEEEDHDHEHSHSHGEEEEGHDHSTTAAESTAESTVAALTTKEAAETTKAPSTGAETAAATTSSIEAVSTAGAGQLGSMGAAAMLVMGALAAF